jgi:hypothetical protein
MAIIGIVRPNWGTPGMSLPLLLNSATWPLGGNERFPLMVSMPVLAVVNVLIFASKWLSERAKPENITGRGAA